MSAEQERESTTPCGCQIRCPLHAAATKLLAALEELLPWIERGRERFDREQARVLTQAIAAIREAKGETSNARPWPSFSLPLRFAWRGNPSQGSLGQ